MRLEDLWVSQVRPFEGGHDFFALRTKKVTSAMVFRPLRGSKMRAQKAQDTQFYAPPKSGCPRSTRPRSTSGNGHAFGGEYLELIPNQRIRYTDKFDDPNLPGVLEVTVSLKPLLCGTELRISQSGIPEAIPLEMCYLGLQESLAQLATLVEPEIPG